MRKLLLFLACLALILSGCSGVQTAPVGGSLPPEQSQAATLPPVPTPVPTPEPTPILSGARLAAGEDYDFSQPVPETEPVEDVYFADAMFLGDSSVNGFQLFSGLPVGDYFHKNGLTVFAVDSEELIVSRTQGRTTLAQALAGKTYGKVYTYLGINELGMRNDQGYYDCYARLIQTIRTAQPQATICIQKLIPVNEKKCRESKLAYYINNENVEKYNQLLYQLAQDTHVFLVDPGSEFVDPATGEPPYDVVADGVHMKKESYSRWLDYLRRHTIDKGVWQ